MGSSERRFGGWYGDCWGSAWVGGSGERSWRRWNSHLLRTRLINPIQAGLISPATDEADEIARLGMFQQIEGMSNGAQLFPSNRIDPRFDGVGIIESSASSIYHALQIDVQKRWSSHSLIQAAYTWSKSIDDRSDVLGVLQYESSNAQNAYDLRADRAVSAFNVPHRLVVNHVLELPWANKTYGLARMLFHGWSFNGIFQIQSGFPATIFVGSRRGITDLTMSGAPTGVARADFARGAGFKPVPAGSPEAATIPAPCARGVPLNPTDLCPNVSGFPFTQLLLGHFGTLGRNTLRLDRLKQFDWAFVKTTPIREGHTLQFRVELYNVFNTPTFGRFVNSLDSLLFGRYTGTDTLPRRVQLGLRYSF